MPVEIKAPVSHYVEADCPAGEALLRLRFDLSEPQYVKVNLRFLPSGWSWSEEMGLLPAGTQVSEVELAELPSGPFVLTASFFAADALPYTGQPRLVASHGVRRALKEMPYLCS